MNIQLPAPIKRPTLGAADLSKPIQILDPTGNIRLSPDCGSGEGGACDVYNQPPVGSSGDFAGEVFQYINDSVGGSSAAKPSALGGNGVIIGALLFTVVLMVMNRGGR